MCYLSGCRARVRITMRTRVRTVRSMTCIPWARTVSLEVKTRMRISGIGVSATDPGRCRETFGGGQGSMVLGRRGG